MNKDYKVCSFYDTETTNVGNDSNCYAICILYIFNDIRDISIRDYDSDNDDVRFYRYENEALEYIDDLIEYGKLHNIIPIICAYNLMFDMQTIMYDLNCKYSIEVNAQSSTNVYTMDLLDEDGNSLLRFWDTFHLEMNGLSAMGETCGLKKASGSWNYSLIRTCETELTDEEIFYAKRDVQVIPEYLKYLLNANEWLDESDFGFKVITKTSLVRQMAKMQIGSKKIIKRNGRRISLLWAFEKTCMQQLPKTFEQYAIRKSCFRGGLTFTSGSAAYRLVENVASLDVTSMHHAFINGRYVPINFAMVDNETLFYNMKYVINSSVNNVLKNYDKPFVCAFHALFEFKNIRLKKDSAFDKWQIGIIPSGKFRNVVVSNVDYGEDGRNVDMENYIRSNGYHDYADKPVFAFGKLYSAEYCKLYLSELELWCIAQVYDWDEINPILGESTVKYKLPPDYVTLQSNILFNRKNDAKFINKKYKEGIPYEYDIPNTIPEGIKQSLLDGTCEKSFFEAYYTSTVKGMFNGIYGTMAQDVFKPKYEVYEGVLSVNTESRTTDENYSEKIPKKCKVLYTYGLRIVGGSRMHLVLAIILLYDRFKDDILITGGDTDSLKISCKEYITNEMILDALYPLHDAIRTALDKVQERVRRNFPELASDLEGIGEFEVESYNGKDRWNYHFEAWNKCRVSFDEEFNPHVTCAGLSRPSGMYTIEDFILALIDSGYDVEEIMRNILGYNVFVTYGICHSVESKKPSVNSIMVRDIKDYKGDEYHIEQRGAIALYNSGRMLGDTSKRTNYDNMVYLKEVQNIDINESMKTLELIDGKAVITIGGEKVYYER